jgi:hypothetical protein
MNNADSEKPAPSEGLTIEHYASARRLPVKFLRQLGVEQIYIGGVPALKMPYLDAQSAEASVRFRHSLNSDERRFSWRKGSKPCLYGLSKLDMARDAGHISIVEGESDCHTLWFHNIPALGVPGAKTWKEQWAACLDGIANIYVVIEPDKGGEAMLAWVQKSAIRDRVRIVKLDGAKDPSELYLNEPARFVERWNAAIADSRPWQEVTGDETLAATKAAWEQCRELAAEEDILGQFAEAMKQRGATGIGRIGKILYLTVTSRLLDRIVSAGLKGPSSCGKSFAVESVLAFFPKDAFYELTAVSDKALAYSEEPLSNRIVVLYEARALDNDWAAYFIRSLLSEGRIVYETVEKTADGLRSRRIERPGPTGLITTTTAVNLHPENETRYLTLQVNDSPGQTQRIIQAQARKFSGKTEANPQNDAALFARWHALQQFLKGAEHRVVIPFADVIAPLIPPVAVRLRRDFPTVMSLVQAHALLHQASRKRDSEGRIIATLVDYAVVRELERGFMAEAAEQSVPKTVRETVTAVEEVLHGKHLNLSGATIREIADRLGIDRSAAHRRVRESIARGFLTSAEQAKQGKITHVVLGDPLPEDTTLLPSVKQVRDRLQEATSSEADGSEVNE